MKYNLISVVFLLVLFTSAKIGFSQVTIESVSSAESAVHDILVHPDDPGIESVSNFKWSGGLGIGKFNNLQIGGLFSSGLVLSTGNVYDIPVPGWTFNDVLASSTLSGLDTNSRFKSLLYGTDTTVSLYDVSFLEFDFKPISDTVKLKIAFASEEYPEFVDSIKEKNMKVDRMGIFIRGERPEYIDENTIARFDSSENIATIPNTFSNIGIEQVHITENYRSFTDFYDSTRLHTNNIVFDGVVIQNNEDPYQAPKWITLNIPVNPCSQENYTMTIVIADARDSLYDSAIFLESESLRTNYRQDEIAEMQVTLHRDVVICPEIGDTATLNVVAEGGWGHYRYNWYKGDGTSQFSLDSTYLINSLENTTTMYVEAIDICDVSEYSNDVLLKLQCPIKIPNVFTPNKDDNVNPDFKIENIQQYENVTMVIYNRYGKKIYENNHYENGEFWDAEGCASGTYFYVLEFKINGEQKRAKGFVTVLR